MKNFLLDCQKNYMKWTCNFKIDQTTGNKQWNFNALKSCLYYLFYFLSHARCSVKFGLVYDRLCIEFIFWRNLYSDRIYIPIRWLVQSLFPVSTTCVFYCVSFMLSLLSLKTEKGAITDLLNCHFLTSSYEQNTWYIWFIHYVIIL